MVYKSRHILAVAVAAAIGLVGCNSSEGQPVTVLRGKSTGTNATRTGISLKDAKRVAGPRFDFVDAEGPWVIAGASWWDGKSWHDDETPPCLDNGAPLELGVVEAAEHDRAPGRGVVVWLKCL